MRLRLLKGLLVLGLVTQAHAATFSIPDLGVSGAVTLSPAAGNALSVERIWARSRRMEQTQFQGIRMIALLITRAISTDGYPYKTENQTMHAIEFTYQNSLAVIEVHLEAHCRLIRQNNPIACGPLATDADCADKPPICLHLTPDIAPITVSAVRNLYKA